MRPTALVVALLATVVAAPAAAATSPKLLPFPNDRFTVKDKHTATGLRLHLSVAQMPRNKDGKPVDPVDIDRFDGFSPGSVILVRVPGLDTPAALAKTNAVSLADIGRYTAKNAPVTVTDAKSRKRWPIWVEIDSNATSPATTLVEIHPARNFLEGHRYVVTMKNLRGANGQKLTAPKPWHFTIASGRSLSERMLHIRDDAFKQLGDTNLADLRVTGAAPKFNVTKVDTFTTDQNPKIATRVTGTFQVPCYLDQPGCPPGSKFHLDPKTGLPAQLPGNELTAVFDCIVPRSASGAAPARVSLYGHGLLGKETEVEAGNVEDMAFEHDIVFCATRWVGMADEDIPNAINILNDASNMPTLADRLQQGFVDFLYLGRLMIHRDGLPANAAFAGLVDTSHLYYDGNSQGGIFGGALTAFAPDFTRAVLGVPAMNYSVLLPRSKDWALYSAIFNPAYPNELDRPLVLDLLQLMWDRGEPDGVAQHMTTRPFANTPAHTVLMQPAVGDFQVTTFQAEVEARTIGARVRTPTAGSGRLPDKLWGIPAIKAFPSSGSALVFWDSGPGHNGPAPLTNVPNASGTDPHSDPRSTKIERDQKSAFLMPDGKVTEVCPAGQECRTDAYAPEEARCRSLPDESIVQLTPYTGVKSAMLDAADFRRMRSTVALAALALALPAGAAAAPRPIPQSDTDTPFVGARAAPNPIASPDPPRHPHMAPNGRSNLHDDAYQTDTYQGPGPLGDKPQVLSTFYANDCGSVTFDARGRIVTVCVGLAGPTLRMLDAKTLDELASFSLPGRGLPNPSHPSPFNDFGGGGYFYLDDADQAVLPTTNGHVYVVGETAPGPGFALKHDYDLSGDIATGDKIFSALPDWSGRIWFASTKGVVGFVDPATGKVATLDTGEEVANSFGIDELGGVYVVTAKALYRFEAGADAKPRVVWKQVYPNSGIAKPGQVDAGSGTTPTITPRGYVAITDNADPMDVVLYDRRDGHEICRVPVFEKGASDSDNSLVSFNDALIVENNYGYNGPQATSQGATTTPGIWRVDYDPDTGGCNVTWKSDEISPTVVPKVSLANGLLYAWTKPAGDSKDPWYLTAIDARTGKTIYKQLAGTGLGFNNNYAPITLGPDGTAYTGVLGGLVAIRDATPPPGAVVPSSTPGPSCATLPGPAAEAQGRRLAIAPSGVADVTLTRWTVRKGRVETKRVRRLRHVTGPRGIAARGLGAGTYTVIFRSGADVRTRVVALRRGRWVTSGLRVQLVRSCVRASLSGPLFDRRGLRVTVVPTDPHAKVTVVARRAGRRRGKPVRPDRVVSTSLVRARLMLGRGTWRVDITAGGRRVGTLTAARPR